MPKDTLSIYLTVQDGASQTLSSITDKTKALDKESQKLQQTYNALQKANAGLIAKKTELQKELKGVNEEVREAKKNFNQLGDEANSDAYKKAQEKQQALRDQIEATNKALKENQRIYKENIETITKGSLNQGLTGSRMAMGLISGQAGQMLSSSAGGYMQYAMESAFGVPTASLLSDSFSSAISGALAGSVFGLPGIIGGGLLGAGAGLLSGYTKIEEAKDDAFKEYYGGLYDDVKARSGATVSSGSPLASSRQTDRISFATLFRDKENPEGKSKEQLDAQAKATADAYLDDLIHMANYTPFLYDDLTAMSKTLATYGYSAKKNPEKTRAGETDTNYILDVLQIIGDTGAALGMATSDMTMVATALGRMKSSDKTTLEYLNILNDRGIGAVGMLADAKGVSVGDMYGKISKGEISGIEAAGIITAAPEEAYRHSMDKQSQTFAGLSSTLEGLQQNLEALGGEGYNKLRGQGISAEIGALGGELGDAIGEINAIMGENQARRENLQEQYEREVLGAVLNGSRGELWDKLDEKQQSTLTKMSEEYAALLERYEASRDADGKATDAEAGAKLEALYEEAQGLGTAYFENSEEVKLLNDTEKEELAAIRENTAELKEATQAAYSLSQERTKGYGSTLRLGGDSSNITETHPAIARRMTGLVPVGSHAYGLERVPYDDYPALLHRDERVLTAQQARQQDAVGNQAVTVQIGSVSLGAGLSTWDIAMAIAQELERAAVGMGL